MPKPGDLKSLRDVEVPTRLKLSALWTALMFCYLYADYFNLFQPGRLQGMLEGRMAPLGPATQAVLLGVSVMMAVPSAMVALTLLLNATLTRWANIVVGLAYAAIVLMTMPGAWLFYLFYGSLDIVLSLAIVWLAWSWPRRD
jgi:hypothetical protein